MSSVEECSFYGGYMPKQKIYFIVTLLSVLFLASVVRAEVSDETAYILNSFLFLVMGFLVMWMAAGFCMLE